MSNLETMNRKKHSSKKHKNHRREKKYRDFATNVMADRWRKE